MTVAELVEQLQTLPQNAQVIRLGHGDEYYKDYEIEVVYYCSIPEVVVVD